MLRQYVAWLGAALVGVVWLASCGAMSFETAPPDEPAPAPVHAPRLTRRDAGPEAVEAGENSQEDGD
jgi:hypothetical protein